MIEPMSIEVVYTAESTATGGGRDGHVKSTTGRIDLDTRPPKEVGGNGEGTNPEELIAAAHAGCFSMAFVFFAESAGATPRQVQTVAEMHFDLSAQGPVVTGMHLHLRADVPGLDDLRFQALAQQAKENCLVSRLLKTGVTLEARLWTEDSDTTA